MRRGFTLIELMVVITIILLVSVVALPVVVPAIEGRQVREAARLLQGQLAGCRDRAIHDGRPSGIRLIPDPAWPLVRLASGQLDPTAPIAYSRILPIGPAPEYIEGRATIQPAGRPSNYPAVVRNPSGANVAVPTLVLESAPLDDMGLPNPPTSWYWNVRVGEKIQIGGVGNWYTIVGPMRVGPAGGNSELFVNVGQPGTRPPRLPSGAPEYLLLTDGRDGDGDGWADPGWDGVDNNGDKYGLVDEPAEWIEAERWQGSCATAAATTGMASVPYRIARRPAPLPGARELALPTQVVIDATTGFPGLTRERSRLPIDPWSGTVELLIDPEGTVTYSLPYGAPSSVGMDAAWLHFWLCERADVRTPEGTKAPLLPLTVDAAEAARLRQTTPLEGSCALVSVAARSGRVATVEDPPFLLRGKYSPSAPFLAIQQGAGD